MRVCVVVAVVGGGMAKNNRLSSTAAYGSSCRQRQTQREREGRRTKEESAWVGPKRTACTALPAAKEHEEGACALTLDPSNVPS